MGNKFYALLLYETELESGISNHPGKWVRTGLLKFTDGLSALNAYAEIPCPASQLVDAETPELLEEEIHKMDENYKNEEWLNKNLYPYL